MSPSETLSPTSIKDAENLHDGSSLASLPVLAATWDRLAARRASRGRRAAIGIDGVRAEVFARNLDRNLAEIARKMARRDDAGTTAYRLGPLVKRVLVTPRGKQRTVYVPRMRDQLVLRVVADTLAASMRQRGISASPPTFGRLIPQLHRAVGSGQFRYALRADVASYYASIPHALLLRELDPLSLHPDVIALIQQLLDCEIRDPLSAHGSGRRLSVGLPTGVSVANLLGELYLSGVDRELEGTGALTFRFVDDFLVLCPDLGTLEAAEQRLRAALDVRGLHISESKFSRTNLDIGAQFIGLDISLGGVSVDPERIARWATARSRMFRTGARLIAEAASRPAAEALLADLVLRVNRDLSGLTGPLVPLLALTRQDDLLESLDRLVLTALGGIFRRMGCVPSGVFRVSSAREWAHRWRESPIRARRAAQRLFSAPVSNPSGVALTA